MTPDVFISYSTKNTDVMEKIVNHLEQNGIKCWFAPRDIAPSQEWVPAIQEALRVAKVFVLIYTSESNASKQVMNEVALAFNNEKIILPFRLTEEGMNYELQYYLTRVHWLDAVFVPLEQSLEDLRKYVAMCLENGTAQPAIPVERKAPAPAKAPVAKTSTPKNNKVALWAGIAAVAILCIGLGIFAIFKLSGPKPAVLMSTAKEAYYAYEGNTQESQTAKANFEKAASKGVSEAYYYLGMMAQRDFDFKKAKEYYEQGVEADNDLCRAALGNLYQKGYGTEADFDKAWELYCEAADHGLVEADYFRGKYVQQGLSGQENNVAKAKEYYQNVVDNGENGYIISYAHKELGLLYRTGSSEIPKDYDAALAEFEQIGYEGNKNLEAIKTYQLAVTYKSMRQEVLSENYYTQMFYIYKEMADEGSIAGMYGCGYCYRYGIGTEKNQEEARKIFIAANAAAKERNAKSCCYDAVYSLGCMYVYGEGVDKDYAKALEYFKEAANAGYGKAADFIGDLYLNGYLGLDADGNADLELARQWYEKAINYGATEAYCNIGYICKRGTDKVPADLQEAMRWYQLGAAAGSPECMFNIGFNLSEQGDEENAMAWFLKAADMGSVDAHRMLGVYYLEGTNVTKDEGKAFDYFLAAADLGDVDSMEVVVEDYFYGKMGQQKNYAEALRYALKGAEKGSVNCMHYCGKIYAKGLDVEQDESLAAQYFTKAAEGGSVDAMEEYGELLLLADDGFVRNVEQGILWLEEADRRGSMIAKGVLAEYYYHSDEYDKAFPYLEGFLEDDYGLGEIDLMIGACYYYGLGTEYDEEQAAIWLSKAHEKGESLDIPESFLVGYCYLYGDYIRQDCDEAFPLIKYAVENSNSAYGCMLLGLCYYGGLGTETDYDLAFYWFYCALDIGGLTEEQESFCRGAIKNMVEQGHITAEQAERWL
ncbi:MAG: toll/interleukin-1 receptor domain-containing protein [Lachnospiraceae bacterium]|nr:toll/interleukin-1 receptor domain-containing protein [Lachnospiraceae bacterium]